MLYCTSVLALRKGTETWIRNTQMTHLWKALSSRFNPNLRNWGQIKCKSPQLFIFYFVKLIVILYATFPLQVCPILVSSTGIFHTGKDSILSALIANFLNFWKDQRFAGYKIRHPISWDIDGINITKCIKLSKFMHEIWMLSFWTLPAGTVLTLRVSCMKTHWLYNTLSGDL